MPFSNTANFGWLYYKEFYRNHRELSFEYLKNDQSTVIGKKLFKEGQEGNAKRFKVNADDFLKLQLQPAPLLNLGNIEPIQCKTTYPGLLLGSGYAHQTGTENEFKLGFFFDHTTGMPTLPGSSVKGVIRSWFPSFGKNKANQKELGEYIYRILFNNWTPTIPPLSEKGIQVIKALENAIFDGIGEDGKPNSIYKRDVFHDAVIVEAKDSLIFGDDYITRHPHPLKNPNPVKFLKIRPEVTFEFRFTLVDSQIGERKVSVSQKRKIFEYLLKNHGIGAKTNVGYGQFEQ